MTLLIPLGLLGLTAIAALIAIYLIRPNYQQKFISSTYVWNLSLKLKKRNIPISKLRNLLLILCQIIFLVACALALAQPVILTKAQVTNREVVAIIDSSASMRAGFEGETRFGRAVSEVTDLADEVFGESGIVSIILAGETPDILAQRATAENRQTVRQTLGELSVQTNCSYGSSDIEGAMEICEEIIRTNSNAQIYLYTDTTYAYVPSSVNVVNVGEEGEWNAGILNAYTVLENNYYTLYVDVACYGVNDTVTLNLQVNGANSSSSVAGKNVSLSVDVVCNDDKTKTVIFRDDSQKEQDYETNAENIQLVPLSNSSQSFYSYDDIQLWLDVSDAFSEDNTFAIYDGKRESINVLYASSLPNPFVPSLIRAIGNQYSRENLWDVRLTQINTSDGLDSYYDNHAVGYDMYIFEHSMPDNMPTDGIVILLDPDKGPEGSGIVMDKDVKTYSTGEIYLVAEDEDVLTAGVNIGSISLTRFRPFSNFDNDYKVLMSADNFPVMIAKNVDDKKIVAINFSLHYSNLAMQMVSLSTLFYNLFENYIPATVVGNAFEVYESIDLNCRGESLKVTGPGIEDSIVFTSFPSSLNLDLPGTYSIYQQTVYGKEEFKDIYVSIPAYECNIWQREDTIRDPYFETNEGDYYDDLILYIASVMVALLFIEWWLQARENL